MRLTDVFSAEAVAIRQTSDASNRMPYVGQAFSQDKKENGNRLKVD